MCVRLRKEFFMLRTKCGVCGLYFMPSHGSMVCTAMMEGECFVCEVCSKSETYRVLHVLNPEGGER